MSLIQNRQRTSIQTQPQPQPQQHTYQTSQTQYLPQQQQLDFFKNTRQATAPFYNDNLNVGLDFDADLACPSLSSSPISTQSLLSQPSSRPATSLSTFDSIPTIAAPQVTQGPSLFDFSPQSNFCELSASSFADTDLMQTESWLSTGQLTPRSAGRISHHHRESSLSSLGSAGPASPFSHNISNPQIAYNDTVGDGFHGLPTEEYNNYQLAKFPGVSHDTLYGNYPAYAPGADSSAIATYPRIAAAPKRRNERGLRPPQEHPIGASTSRPMSVASSVTGDSPATPANELEDEGRQKNGETHGFGLSPDNGCSLSLKEPVPHSVPKLNRTITDIFNDELYNPNFTITSATPAQMPVSPTNNDVFNQRLQAANNQHLSVNQSPVSRDHSPFLNGSPHAAMPYQDFPANVPSAQARLGSAQQLREQNKAAQDARALQQQMAAHAADTSTPQTISPKDALLEFHDTDGDANFPLFPQQGTNGFDADAVSKAVTQSQQAFDAMVVEGNFNFLHPQLPSGLPNGLQVPQQYPFISQPRQQSSVPSLATSRMSSTEAGTVDSTHSGSPQRPANTNADGGTYTCTYHGCTLRFETPALLQKHKREGHRQAHGLNARKPDAAAGMTSSFLNSQAGPHKCDRINPSTGKPCNTIFSRPYDLTRHEDTIHNARKQKVRCNLCTDEKTFSRADALTRHYRVCHPDVEFPGKQRKRGGQGG